MKIKLLLFFNLVLFLVLLLLLTTILDKTKINQRNIIRLFHYDENSEDFPNLPIIDYDNDEECILKFFHEKIYERGYEFSEWENVLSLITEGYRKNFVLCKNC